MTITDSVSLCDCSNRNSVEGLYQELGRAAVSKTEYLVGSINIAKEIVNEVFLKLWQAKLTFPNKKAAYMWIYRSCHNAGIDFIRSAKIRKEVMTDMDVSAVPVPSKMEERLHNRTLLENILNSLDEEEACIIAYRYIDGLKIKNIADLMGISEKTVSRILERVKQRHKEN